MNEFVTKSFDYLGNHSFHFMAVLAGLLALSIAVRKRRENGLEGYNLAVLRSAMFGGATVAMMLMLCLGSFNDEMLRKIVEQERFLLFFAAIFAAANEVSAIAELWSKKDD